MNLTLVIPVFNEAESLKVLLPALIEFCNNENWSISIVNDGSTDNTKTIIQEYDRGSKINIIDHKINRGYGGAIKSGIERVETDYVATFDADGQHAFEDVKTLLDVLQETDADLVIGNRIYNHKKPIYREVGKRIIRVITRILLSMNINDLNSGLKIFRTDTVKQYLFLCPDSMAFSEIITIIFIDQKRKVVEHPVTVQKRIAGKSTISTRTAFDTLMEIFNIIMFVNPLRFFLPISSLCIILGLAWGIPIILMGRGVSVGSMLSILIGVIFFFLGLVAEQLSTIRKEILFIKQNRE